MPKIEKAFIQIYIGLILTLFLWNSVSIIRFPFGVDYGEAPLMDQASRIQNRATLYKSNINEPPYIIANYPPLYPTWVAATNAIFKIPLFQAGRISSVFFSLVSGVLIGLFTSRLTENKWCGVFSAAIFWGHPYVLRWSSLARVDLMALAFSLLGLWILFRYRESGYAWMLAGGCFLASAFTRQTYLLAAPLAGFVWLWHDRRKRALIFLSSFGVMGMLIFGMINALTQGGFYMNIVLANINQFVLDQVLRLGKQLFITWPIILITCAIIVVLAIYKKYQSTIRHQSQDPPDDFIFSGLVFYSLGALITAVTIGKVGSNVNYLLEFIAACSIWIGLALKLINEYKHKLKFVFLGLLFVQSAWVLSYSFILSQSTTGGLVEKLHYDESLYTQVQEAVKTGVVLSDDYMDMLVLSGQPIYYQPFEYGELYTAGLWDPTRLVNQINQGAFPLIIIGGSTLHKNCCWTASMINALELNYHIETEDDTLILRPLK